MDISANDYFEIMQLYARYARAIDSGDGRGWAQCYAENGRYLSSTFGECNGRAELEVFAVDHFKRWSDKGIQTRHWNNQVLVERNSDGTVSSSVYLLLAGVSKGEAPKLYLQTVYTDKLIQEDGRWVLKERQSNADMRPDPSQLGFTRWETKA
jgi:3-phenylpropionate/cinnamic acid dioxygenase small subunit